MTRLKIDPMVRIPELLRMLGVSRATVYRLMRAGEFPQSIKLIGARPKRKSPVGWPLSQVQKYLRARPKSNLEPEPAPPQEADGFEPRQGGES